jgi:hypothetical protein
MLQPRFMGFNQEGAAQMSVRVLDSSWSGPLEVGLEGAGGAFQLVGNRWPNLDDRSLDRTHYDLTYAVGTAPAPWDRTRVVTFQNRFTVCNDGPTPLVVAQAGAAPIVELASGASAPFHWPDFQREPHLVASFPKGEHARYRWSGAVDIASIADFPLLVRPVDRYVVSRGYGL